VAGSCEHGDESVGSGATELVKHYKFHRCGKKDYFVYKLYCNYCVFLISVG
jgi:ribosomal protein L37E